ncbi:hypothetical protein R3P38DRAFT_106502 [Favolaschia claudopus]|uniref:Uncharacterized protein n=1 Tax=Favolaschia claudopus TaxID=2862362 RepID=A0AAV9ZXB4_9AGAR
MTSRTRRFHRDPYPPTSRKVLLLPASKPNKSSIVSRTFAELDLTYEPLGFERIDLDARALHGEKNLFAARQVCFQSDTLAYCGCSTESYERYTLHYNLNPDLPENKHMARLVGVNPEKPHTPLPWRGDIIVVKWREWPDEHPDYVDFQSQDVELFRLKLIPNFYHHLRIESPWVEIIQLEQEFGAHKCIVVVEAAHCAAYS